MRFLKGTVKVVVSGKSLEIKDSIVRRMYGPVPLSVKSLGSLVVGFVENTHSW